MDSSEPLSKVSCKKGRPSVVIDIEREYNSYLRDIWQELSEQTKNFGDADGQLKETYNAVSTGSIEFLKGKLENLEKPDS